MVGNEKNKIKKKSFITKRAFIILSLFIFIAIVSGDFILNKSLSSKPTKYYSSNDAFQIIFPKSPKISKQNKETKKKVEVSYSSYIAKLQESSYSVDVATYKSKKHLFKKKERDILDLILGSYSKKDGIVARHSDNYKEFDNQPIAEGTYELIDCTSATTLRLRVIIKGNNLYYLKTLNVNKNETDNFFNSFKFTSGNKIIDFLESIKRVG